MRIQHNIAALNSHRQLTNNNNAVSKSLEKLSSGYRINRAGDDAAGLAISEKMRAQITGLETAQKNANDGISLIQTAEGALTEVHSMLNRMVELANQSANGVYDNATDRANLQKEMESLTDEINRISEGTNFNGINLLDGSLGTGSTGAVAKVTGATAGAGKMSAVDIKISGLEAGKTVTINTSLDAAAGITFDADGNATVNIAAATAGTVIKQADIDKMLRNATLPESAKDLKIEISNDITVATAAAGTTTNVVAADGTMSDAKQASSADTTNGITFTADAAGAAINGKTIAFSTAGSKGVSIAANGNVTIGLETGKSYSANEINKMLSDAGAGMSVAYEGSKTEAVLRTATDGVGAAGTFTYAGGAGLADGGGLQLQIGDTADSFNQLSVKVGNMSATALGIGSINISNQAGAKDAVALIKTAINSVSSTRGDLGALQNRLEHTINNLSVTTENMTAAESRIRDVDMAKEMMTYTKNNILVQSSQAMLAQANQLPQGVLQLLQ